MAFCGLLDVVEGSINLNGIKLDLLDTAGIHESNDEVENIGINIEIKTVNHRYFDFNCRTGRGYGFLDEKLKNHIQSRISRCKVDFSLNVTFF